MKMIHVVSLCLSQSIVLARHHQSVLSQGPIQVYWTSVWCRTTRQAVADPHLPAIAPNHSPPYSTKWKVFHPAFQASTYWKRGLRIAWCPQGSRGIRGNGSGGPSGRWSWNIQKNWFVAHFLGLKRWEFFLMWRDVESSSFISRKIKKAIGFDSLKRRGRDLDWKSKGPKWRLAANEKAIVREMDGK